MSEKTKALVKRLFLALHFLDLMGLTGCEYRMELAGLLGVMCWEITVPLIRVGAPQARSLFLPSLVLLPRLPVWLCMPGALHIPWESACRLVSAPGVHLTPPAVAAASPLWPAGSQEGSEGFPVTCQTTTSEDYLYVFALSLTPRDTQEISEHLVFWG